MLKNRHEATKVDQGKVMEHIDKQNYQQNTVNDQLERSLINSTKKDNQDQHDGENNQADRHISSERSDEPNEFRRTNSVSYHLTGRMLKAPYRMHSSFST